MATPIFVEDAPVAHPTQHGRAALLALVYLHVAVCCVSLFYVTFYYSGYHILKYEPAQLLPALLTVAPLVLVAFVFVLAPFSFGYVLGFVFYTMILGYIWLSKSSILDYEHTLANISAVVSIVAFLAPALFITAPLKHSLRLSKLALERFLLITLAVAVLVVAVGALFNFRLVGMADMYTFRGQLEFPAPLRYAIGTCVNALLPFAFACYLALGKPLRAFCTLILLALFYPVTLTKLTLFAPFWLAFLWLLGRLAEARIAVVLSLLLPLFSGVALLPLLASGALSYEHFIGYFGTINFRMFAMPSIALDLYNDFFSRHEITRFCQIQLLKPFVTCPYNEYLSVIMSKVYDLGAVNASLFATEGIASVGPKLAPLSALACGIVIALANRLSAGLPPRFILLSGGLLLQILLNVPLTTSLLSYGAAILFLLWFITPRDIFDRDETFIDPRRA
jgi:hypothetical protein